MVRFAAIGTSWITTQFADAVARVPGAELAVVYSRDAGRAAASQISNNTAWRESRPGQVTLPREQAIKHLKSIVENS